jgi:hypothetical protein
MSNASAGKPSAPYNVLSDTAQVPVQDGFIADRRDDGDPVAPPPELREAAYLKTGETFETRRNGLANFKTRIQEYSAIPGEQNITFFGRDDDAYLLSFLRCKKMNIDEAWDKYLNFCKHYSRESWLFNVDTALVRRLYESRSFEVLTKRDASNRVILSMKCEALIPIVEEYGPQNVKELLKAIFCVLQVFCFADVDAQVHGGKIGYSTASMLHSLQVTMCECKTDGRFEFFFPSIAGMSTSYYPRRLARLQAARGTISVPSSVQAMLRPLPMVPSAPCQCILHIF